MVGIIHIVLATTALFMGSLVTAAPFNNTSEYGELLARRIPVGSRHLTLYYLPGNSSEKGERDQTDLGDGGPECPIPEEFKKRPQEDNPDVNTWNRYTKPPFSPKWREQFNPDEPIKSYPDNGMPMCGDNRPLHCDDENQASLKNCEILFDIMKETRCEVIPKQDNGRSICYEDPEMKGPEGTCCVGWADHIDTFLWVQNLIPYAKRLVRECKNTEKISAMLMFVVIGDICTDICLSNRAAGCIAK